MNAFGDYQPTRKQKLGCAILETMILFLFSIFPLDKYYGTDNLACRNITAVKQIQQADGEASLATINLPIIYSTIWEKNN